MSYKPEFKLTTRNGKTALWVSLPNGERNIWDLYDTDINDKVLKALQSAFYLGVEAQQQLTQSANIQREWLKDWTDHREDHS